MASTTTHPQPANHARLAEFEDPELLRAAAGGDDEAFATIFRRHVGALRGFIVARVGPVAADDLVTETFAVAWRSSARFDHRYSSARPWLYGIATKLLQRHREVEQRWQRSLEAGAIVADAQTAPEDAARDTADPELVRAIARLDVREREVLLLHALGELRIVEVAAVIGISPVAARLRLFRARKQLIAEMKGARDA